VTLVAENSVNLGMVKAGYAKVYRENRCDDIFDSAPYCKAEGEARAGKRAMWAQRDKPVSPRERRKARSAN